MSNINPTESVRSVVTDGGVRSEQATARSTPADGKSLPPSTSEKVTSQAVEPPPAQPQVSERAVQQLNDYVQSFQRNLRFSLDEESGRSVVRVVDTSTDEVIRQIPNDVALRLARNLKASVQSQELVELAQGEGTAADASLGLINTRI